MSDKLYEVVISERAMTMLLTHVRFLAQVSVTAARKLKELVIDEIKKLEYMPESYSWFVSEYVPANKYRKMLVGKRYLVIYQVSENSVFVDYILDCRQDYQWLR